MFTALSSISINDLQPSTGTGIQSAPGASTPKPVTVPLSQTDTVKLSVTQQVRNLHAEGEGPGQIASSLGLTSTQVNGDLYVSLTWPQLLSKVASSSLTFGSTSSESVSATPDTAATVPAPASTSTRGGSATPATGFPEAKSSSIADASIFPAAKDASTTSVDGASKSATAA